MNKIVKIALVAIGLIGAILWFMLPSRAESEADPAGAAQNGAMAAMFMITYLLLAVAIIFSLGFALKNMFSNPQGLKKTLFAVGGFALIAIISYVISSGTDVGPQYMEMSDEATVKKIGMGLNVFFILAAVAVILMIVPSVKKLVGK